VLIDWLSRLTPEEKAKLYKGIGYDEAVGVKKMPREVCTIFECFEISYF